jgi:retron-type reverse transcriptase
MTAICIKRAERALRSYNRWLKNSADQLLKSETTVSSSRLELSKQWQKEWRLYTSSLSNDAVKIIDDIRLGIGSGGNRQKIAPSALYCLRAMIAAKEVEFDGLDVKNHQELEDILNYLLSSQLSQEFSDFEINIRKQTGKIPAVSIGKLLQAKDGADLLLFKSILGYSARENGKDDFSATLSWGGCKEFSRRRQLHDVWPSELQGGVDEKLLRKLPIRIQQVILADRPKFFLNKTLSEKLHGSPLGFKNAPDTRRRDLSINRFIKQPWNTFRKITEGKADPTLVSNVWRSEVLNRIKDKSTKLWLQPWVFSKLPKNNRLHCSELLDNLDPQLACLVGFLAITDPLEQLKWLIRCSQESEGFKLSQIPVATLLSLIGKIPLKRLDSTLLGELSQCDRSYWQRLAPSLPGELLKRWCGPTNPQFLNWILDKESALPAYHLDGFHEFTTDLFTRGKITIDPAYSDFLETLDLQKLAYDRRVIDLFGVLLQGADAKVGRWVKSAYSDHKDESAIRIAISLKIPNASPECRKAFCVGLTNTTEWVRFLVESKILQHREKSVPLLSHQKNGKSRARLILELLRTKEGSARFGKLVSDSLYSVLKTQLDIFADELARFFPDRIGEELWAINKTAMLQAACGSPRTADWIYLKVPSSELRSLIPDVRKNLSEKPTLASAIEIGLLTGVRYLPLLTRLAFKRWTRDPRKSPGKIFDDHYHTFTLPKKAGGTRVITAPSAELKRLQRRLLDRLLIQEDSHPAVHGYIAGRSCATNAKSHEKREIVAKLDIKAFFPSTPYHLIVKALKKMAGDELSQGGLFLLADICSYDGGLPIGAPCSPTLGNIILTRFDEVVGDRAERIGVTYTRYADDLVFSGDRSAIWMLGFAKGLLKKIGYVTDNKKELIMRKGMRQTVTGLVVNSSANLPRRQRRKLRAALHSMSLGKEPKWHGKPASKKKIIGILGFLHSVNHESAETLKSKYLPNGKEDE